MVRRPEKLDKKKLGRPKGVKNKPKDLPTESAPKKDVKDVKKKLGRPKGTKNKPKDAKDLSTESKSGTSTERSTDKSPRKSVSASTSKEKVASKDPRKSKNELAQALDDVKGKKRGKKKTQKAKILDETNKRMKWVGLDQEGNEMTIPREEGEVMSSRSGKMLGYCPECDCMVCDYDMESKFIFICNGCDCRARTNKLLSQSKSSESRGYSSKKEYFESTINSKHLDMPTHSIETPNFKKD